MNKFEKALRAQDKATAKKKIELTGTLGVYLGGVQVVEVPNRAGFVYVMLNTKEQELIQAFNDKVSAVYGLAVKLVWNTTRYEIIGKDVIRYGTWNSSFLPKHGNQHSFNPDGGGGGDVSFIYGKQFVPLSLTPSGTFGAQVAVVAPYPLQNAGWHYVPAQTTPNLISHRPTNNEAKMVLVCLDWQTQTPQIILPTGTFSANLTGSADVIPYLPTTTGVFQIPIAGIRLVSGTTAITWQNIYDVRQYFHPIYTGTSSYTGSSSGQSTGTSGGGVDSAQYSGGVNTTTISNGGNGTITITDEVWDTASLASVGSNTITVAEAGTYQITVEISWDKPVIGTPNGVLGVHVNTSEGNHEHWEHFETADDMASNAIHMNWTAVFSTNDTIAVTAENYMGMSIRFNVKEVTLLKIA